jgi:hypothetical protein
VCLHHVSVDFALITRPSIRAEKGKMSPSKKFGTKPHHCAGHPNRCRQGKVPREAAVPTVRQPDITGQSRCPRRLNSFSAC